jgi:hypothetical protein
MKYKSLSHFNICILLLMFSQVSTSNAAGKLFYNITDYGAKKDLSSLSTRSIQAAIDDCSRKGGGTVLIPAGSFVTGTIFLKSHVRLHLEAGAILEGSKRLEDYPVTISHVRSYTDNYTDKSLIFAEDLEDISITGQGTIDGNGASFELNGPYKVRPYLIRIINCKKIRVSDVSILNSPMWVQHYLACDDINISGITVNSRVNSNNDGIDIDGCSNVRISDCNIISGDDAIVFKSTLDRPCRNATVTNCVLSSDCNALKFGTETNGGFQNIVVDNCTIYDTHLAGITLQMVDGGILDRITVSNITMSNVGAAIFIRLGDRARPYKTELEKPGPGKLSHVLISNIQGTGIGTTGCAIAGLKGNMTEDIRLSGIDLTFKGGGSQPAAGQEVPEVPAAYPEHDMFGRLPAWGFWCRHCKEISFSDIRLRFEKNDGRPALLFDDTEDLVLESISAQTDGAAPELVFNNVNKAFIHSCIAPEGTKLFLNLRGSENKKISLIGNDLRGAGQAFSQGSGPAPFMEGNRITSVTGISEGRYTDCDIKYTDDREIRIHTPAEVLSKRKEIIKAIWGKDVLPDRSDIRITVDVKNPLSANTSIFRIDKFEVPVNTLHGAGIEPLYDLAYMFTPVKRNNRLVLLNPGHSCTLKTQEEDDPGIGTTILGLLRAGFDVLAVFMPHVSETGCDLNHCAVINTQVSEGEQKPTYGLRLFLEPELVCLNYLQRNQNYRDINMVGLSGGGWTTNLLAAVDERISYSFNVAGSMPLYYRSGGSMGDIEQFIPELYRDIAGYPDLYILGSYGKGRKQVQILNRRDNCCFGQKQHDPYRSYDGDIHAFETSVRDNLKRLGAEGHYYAVIDETAANHQISSMALNDVIIKELKTK